MMNVDGDVVKTPSSSALERKEENVKAGKNEQDLKNNNAPLIFDTAGRYNATASTTPGDENHGSGHPHQEHEDDLGSSGSFVQQGYFVPLGSERFAANGNSCGGGAGCGDQKDSEQGAAPAPAGGEGGAGGSFAPLAVSSEGVAAEKIMRVYDGDCAAVDGRYYAKPNGDEPCTGWNGYAKGFAMPARNVDEEKNDAESPFASCKKIDEHAISEDIRSFIGRCRGNTMKFRYKNFDDFDVGSPRWRFQGRHWTNANVMFLKKLIREEEESVFFWKKDLFDWDSARDMFLVSAKAKEVSFEMSCDEYDNAGKKEGSEDDYSVTEWPSSKGFFSGNDCDLIRIRWDKKTKGFLGVATGGEVQVESWTCPDLKDCGIPPY
ncbi:unnamed protein product [Amoebophrya sp. A120]|nr:unnamed protein product [Amoebophrya sp. A120]|eukprot:GSA120T00025595001.1